MDLKRFSQLTIFSVKTNTITLINYSIVQKSYLFYILVHILELNRFYFFPNDIYCPLNTIPFTSIYKWKTLTRRDFGACIHWVNISAKRSGKTSFFSSHSFLFSAITEPVPDAFFITEAKELLMGSRCTKIRPARHGVHWNRTYSDIYARESSFILYISLNEEIIHEALRLIV